jgi:phospholipid/cholesterol/gamma-HCH transport system permease protein
MRSEAKASGDLTLEYSGRLDAAGVAELWRKTEQALDSAKPKRVAVLAEEVEYCDGSGIGLLFSLQLRGRKEGFDVDFKGLKPDYSRMLDMFDAEQFAHGRIEKGRGNIVTRIGAEASRISTDFVDQVVFLGRLFAATLNVVFHRGRLRWKEVWLTAERAGANAVGIVSLIGFLFGLIIAFSSAMPLRQFGADVFVADLTAIGLIRVIGPFVTAIIIAGRSGSSYAAELGTMKINDEIDALKIMGLDPIRFLVVPKVLATIMIAPLLTILANLCGLVGSGIVILSLGFPFVVYTNHLQSAIDPKILLIGLFKAMVFGGLIAGVGCLRGLQTKTGPSAVGISTTNAVVSGIVLIVIAEGIFAVLLHYLGI